ncbi:hypothetical protein Tco_0025081 [Tanacetum coccineum]
MLQSPPVRRALSSRLKLRHLRKVRVWRKDADISSGIGLHVPSFFTSRSTISIGMDISKITRKSSKTGKHGHEERKSTKEARDAKPKAGKVKKSKLWSTLGQFSVNKSQP